MNSFTCCLDANEHLSIFNNNCLNILNYIAQLKAKKRKHNSAFWHNDTTRSLRQACRKAERKWKKDKLQVSYEILRDSLSAFQRAAKAAKCKHFSELITQNSYKPNILFSAIETALHPNVNLFPEVSVTLCENFAVYFTDKISEITAALSLSSYKLVDVPYSDSIWSEFESVNLNTLIRIMSSLKSTMCPQDVFPPRFLRQIIDTVGSDLLSVINKCLQTGTVPHDFKLATVRPHLKKTNLDSTLLSNFRPISNLPFLSKILEKAALNQL